MRMSLASRSCLAGGSFCLEESFVGLNLILYPEFHLPMCPETGLKVCVLAEHEVIFNEHKDIFLKPNLVLGFGPNQDRLWPKPGLWPLVFTLSLGLAKQ